MPERHPASVEVKDGIPKVPRVSEDRSDRHVLSRAPRRKPGPHKEPHSAPGSHKVPEGLALDVVPFAPREHDLNREDVLKQPAVLIRTYPQPVLGQPAADGGSRSARGVDRRSHTLLAQTVSEDQPSDPRLDINPILSRALRESYVAHLIETHYKDLRHPARIGSGARSPGNQRYAVARGEFHQRLDLLGALRKHGSEGLLVMRFHFAGCVPYEASSKALLDGIEGFFGNVAHMTPFHRPRIPVHADHALDS